MEAEEDELDINPFFLALQGKYKSIYQAAQDKGCVICVPQSTSLAGADINADFVETHILRPSPFFKGEYTTVNKDGGRRVHVENSAIHTGEGFEEPAVVKILSEEVGYSKNMKTFRVLVIESPFINNYKMKKPFISDNQTEGVVQRISHIDNENYLKSYQECQIVFAKMEDEIRRFNNNYLVIPGYLDDAAEKIQTICDQNTKKFLQTCHHPLKPQKRFTQAVAGAVQSCVLHGVYPKLYPVILRQFMLEEEVFKTKCQRLKKGDLGHIGLDPECKWDQEKPMAAFKNIAILQTPREMIDCISSTSEELISAWTSAMSKLKDDSDIPVVTADEAISLWVSLIIQSEVPDILALAYYVQTFQTNAAPSDAHKFQVVTFMAAVEYVKNQVPAVERRGEDDTSKTHTQADMKSVNRQNDKTAVTVAPEMVQNSGHIAEPGSESPRSSKLDQQMNRISRMMKSYSVDSKSTSIPTPLPTQAERDFTPRSIFSGSSYTPVQRQHTLPADPSSSKQQLGGFLSALKNDALPSSFGKKS